MIQPLQYAKGWKKDGYLAITDLKGCYEMGCPEETGSEKKWIYLKHEINIWKDLLSTII